MVLQGNCTIAICGHLLDMPRLAVEGREEGIPLGLVPLAAEDEDSGAAKKSLIHANESEH